MQSIQRYILNFDAFWVTFNPNINPNSNQSYYRTTRGGFVSMIIYMLWLIYAGDLLRKWFGNEMVMTVSTQEKGEDNDRFIGIFNNSKSTQNFEVTIWWNEDNYLDVFQEDEIIVLPIMIDFDKSTATSILYLHNQTNQSLQISLQENQHDNEYMFIFVQCIGNEVLLDIGQKCASQEKVDQFWLLTGLEIWTSHTTYTLDLYAKEIKKTISQTTLTLQPSFAQYSQIRMGYTFTEIYSGIMFQENLSFMLKTSYVETVQFTAGNYLNTYFMEYTDNNQIFHNVLGAMYLAPDKQINYVVAQYPTINEILARMGSTLQTLLLVKYILCYFNRKKMIQDFREFCKTIYFPEICHNNCCKGNICLNQKSLKNKENKQLLKLIEKKFDEKLNYANLIYEVSRMQILLLEVISQQKIVESHLENKPSCYHLQDQKMKDPLNILLGNFLFSYSTGKWLQTQKKQELAANNLRSQELQSQFSQALRVNQELLGEDIQLFQSGSMRPQQSC